MAKNKVLIIGIDGGTFDMIRPMAEAGELPVLSSLMKEGVWGPLESTIPPDTSPAWVSMMTGVNPGKHGVFFFLDSLHNNARLGRSLGSADIKSPPLWSILSGLRRKVLFVNVPFTYPPPEVNGVVVSGMLIPDSASRVSSPPEAYEELAALLDGYEINDWSPDVIGAEKTSLHSRIDSVVRKLASITEKRTKATIHLLERHDWDLSWVVFTSIDRLQHLFWKSVDPGAGQASPEINERYRKIIYDGYRQLDGCLGRILETAGRDTTVMIVSDHGFGPLEKYFFVNKWLEEIGLLTVRKFLLPRKFRIRRTTLRRALARLTRGISAPAWAEKVPLPIPGLVRRETAEMIDWGRTRAYGDPSGGISVNLRGREPLGIVAPGAEYEGLLAFIREEFSRIVDGASSRKGSIADYILRKEEIYGGPYVPEAADLYYSLNERSYLHRTEVHGDGKFGNSSVGSGMHRQNGIFIMRGPLCRRGDQLKPRIIDVTPTALYLMGVPVPEEMDGRVLKEGVDAGYLASHPVERTASGEYRGEHAGYSAQDEEKIRDGLKSLGYL